MFQSAPSQPPGTRKRILLTTFGSLGDLHPFLALAAGLRARGHHPVIAASPSYRERIAAHGVGFAPVRPDLPDLEVRPELMRVMMDPRRGTEAVIREVVLPALRDTYDDTLAAAEGADLLVSHLLTFTTPLVAAQRGIPWVSTALQPSSMFSVHEPPVPGQAPWLARLPFLGPWFWRAAMRLFARGSDAWFASWRELQADVGLPDTMRNPIFDAVSPWLTLALFSPRFGAPQPDWPPRTLATGFPFLHPPGGTLSPELEAFLATGPAPIVFTLGSAAVLIAGDFYRESAMAAANLGHRAILLAGSEATTLSASLPEGVIAVDYAPHAAIFPRAAAIVHQGGIGTTAEAMRSGKPMLVMPFAHDQFDNAYRVERLGIGREISRKRYDAAYAAQELQKLLEDPRYRQRATIIGEQISAEDGVASACAALEPLLRVTSGPSHLADFRHASCGRLTEPVTPRPERIAMSTSTNTSRIDVPAADADALEALFRQLLDGWNQGSGEGFAAPFAEDADQIAFDGTHFRGRQEIAQFHQMLFDRFLKGSRLVGKITDMRLLAPDVALMHAIGGTVMSGESDLAPDRNSVQTMVGVKQNGEWRLAALQNSRAEFMGRPDAAQAMTEELRKLI